MVDTPDAVRRDIERTRKRMSSTLSQLERKVNVMQMVRDHPWSALGIALGAGVVLARSGTDAKAATETMGLTRSAGTRVGALLDDVVARLVHGLQEVVEAQIDNFVEDLKETIRENAPATRRSAAAHMAD
jgi:hypothetical protein